MASTCFRRFLLLLIFLPAFLAVSRNAHACSCGPLPTVLDSYDGSDVVVIARVISVEKYLVKLSYSQCKVNKQIGPETDPTDYYVDGVRTTTMVVEKVFKGN